jgi:hypothetical protein
MAALYTREANRARLSKGAIGKLERTPEEHSIPAPDERCGLQEKIPNEINAKFWEWCGREDSNLHGLPR